MKGTKHKRKTLPEQSLIINYRLKEEAVIVGERERERIVTFGKSKEFGV